MVSRLQVAGELDIAVAGDFNRTVRKHLETGDVVIDLSGLDFVDVTGMQALATARAAGARMEAPPARLVRLLERIGLRDQVLGGASSN